MAIGDSNDQLARLQRLIPPQWPGDGDTLWRSVLGGFASIKAWLYDAIGFARLQTRVKTATGGFLDAVSTDFLGNDLPRNNGEADDSFRTRILLDLFRERATRPAMTEVLLDLTGREPHIFEPARIADTGSLNAPTMGYGAAGAYGSLRLPFESFVEAYRPINVGVPRLSGYNVSAGGYDSASALAYVDADQTQSGITDAAILYAINRTKPIATIVWVRIVNDAGTESFPTGDLVEALPGYPLQVGGKAVLLSSRFVAIN